MCGIRPHILTNSQIAHGVGDDIALDDHDSVLGHRAEMRFAVVSARTCVSERRRIEAPRGVRVLRFESRHSVGDG